MCAIDKIFADDLAPVGDTAKPKRVNYYNLMNYMKLKHKLATTPRVAEDEKLYTYDNLALLTGHAKAVVDLIKGITSKMQETVAYKIMTRTTQPAHVILFISAVTLAFVGSTGHSLPSEKYLKFWKTMFMIVFSVHFGTHVWMNLISGLVLYFSMPRQVFGDVQIVIFPAYYSFQAIMSFLNLVVYMKLHPIMTLTSDESIFAALQAAKFLTELSVRLYIAPKLIKLKHLKAEYEMAAGNGREIGTFVLGELQQCPNYMRILRRFRKIHSGVAIAAMACLAVNGYQISTIVSSVCAG